MTLLNFVCGQIYVTLLRRLAFVFCSTTGVSSYFDTSSHLYRLKIRRVRSLDMSDVLSVYIDLANRVDMLEKKTTDLEAEVRTLTYL